MALEIWGGRTVEIKARPKEIIEMNRQGEVTLQAIRAGMNLSQFLERQDPSSEWETNADGTRLDAFGRVMRAAGIRTVTDPLRGVYADRFEAFEEKGLRAFIPEWVGRRWREARYGQPINPHAPGAKAHFGSGPAARSVFTSADEGLGTIWRPYFDVAQERVSQIAPPIPLARLTAQETGIDGDSYRAAYITDPAAEDIRKYRVGETAEIPLAKIAVGQKEIRLFKYGRGFEVSYEQLRRQRIDKVAFWVARHAIQDEVDKVEHAVDTLINGDGNGNGATSYNLLTLDPAAGAGVLTTRGWLTFKSKFVNAYNMDVLLGTEADYIDIQLLALPNNNTLLAQLTGPFGQFTQINQNLTASVAIGKLESTPTDKLVGIDTRFALEHIFEIGANITESENFVTRQTQVVVMTETEGFGVLDQKATRVLNLAA